MKSRLFTISMLLSVAAFDATAQEAPLVDFTDPQAALAERHNPRLNLNLEFGAAFDAEQRQSIAVALVAGIPDAIEISLSQRVSAADEEDRSARATEVRVGRGLLRAYEEAKSGSSAYVFVASNQSAVTWRPDARSEFGGRGDALALQNRVEIGDLSAGVTYERSGVQASLAYVEREESARIGRESFSQEQRFSGITVTMRR